MASQVAERILDQRPGDRRVAAVRCWMAGRQGHSQEADTALGELAARAEELGLLRDRNRLALRRARLRDGLGAPARALFEEALELALGSQDGLGAFLAREELAALAVRMGDRRTAEEALTAFLATAIETGREAQALARTAALASLGSEGGSAAALVLGRRALLRGEPKVAAGWLQEALRRDPANGRAASHLEALCLGQGLWDDLASLYQFQAERSTGLAQAGALAKLAELLEDEQAKPREALAAYEAAALAGLGVQALREQLRLCREIGDLPHAQRALDDGVSRAQAPDPLSEVLLLRARWRRSQGDGRGAWDDLERALELRPGFWPAIFERAEVQSSLGEAGGAQALQLALDRPGVAAADRADGYRCLARLLAGPLGRPTEARAAWERVYREDPDSREATAFLREAYRQSGERGPLLALVTAELERDPRALEATELRRELARLLAAEGRTDEAMLEWRKIARAEPTAPDALAALQDHCAANGQWQEARELLERAIAAQPDPHARALLLDQLAALLEGELGDPARAGAVKAKAAALRASPFA